MSKSELMHLALVITHKNAVFRVHLQVKTLNCLVYVSFADLMLNILLVSHHGHLCLNFNLHGFLGSFTIGVYVTSTLRSRLLD